MDRRRSFMRLTQVSQDQSRLTIDNTKLDTKSVNEVSISDNKADSQTPSIAKSIGSSKGSDQPNDLKNKVYF